MEFLFILILVGICTRKYKGINGVRPVRLNPNLYRESNVFMVMFNLVMKEGRIN